MGPQFVVQWGQVKQWGIHCQNQLEQENEKEIHWVRLLVEVRCLGEQWVEMMGPQFVVQWGQVKQ